MRKKTLSLMLLLLLTVLHAGCRTASKEDVFSEVQEASEDRARQRIEWNCVTTSEADIGSAVDQLIHDDLTLEEAVQISLLNNRHLQSRLADLGVARAELLQAGLLRNPVFSVAVRFPTHGSGGQVWEGDIMQDFLDVLLVGLRRRLASAELERVKLLVTDAVIGLAFEVRRTFYDYQAAKQKVELRQLIAQTSQASYEMARRLREAGNITDLQLVEKQEKYEQSKLDWAQAELRMYETREQLNRLMGLWGDQTKWNVAAPLPQVPQDELTIQEVEQKAIERNLDLQAQWLRMEMIASRYGIEQLTAILPALEMGTDFEIEREDQYRLIEIPKGDEKDYELDEFKSPNIWWIGPRITGAIPIFNQGQAVRDIARWTLRGYWEEYSATAVDVRSRARQAALRLATLRQTALYHRNMVLPLKHRMTEQTQLQYNAMQRGTFDLLHAKNEEFHAGERYLQSLREYWLSRLDLEEILAGRTPQQTDQRENQDRSEPRFTREAADEEL